MGILEKIFKPFNDYKKEKKIKKQIKNKLELNPINIIFKELENINGKIEDFHDFLEQYGKIGIILGARGTGKSALGMRILENINAKNKRVYALGFRKDRLPKWIIPIDNFEGFKEMKNNSFLLADESGIEFSSRSSMTSINKLLSELLLITRHKNISIIFITQNSSNIEVNTLRQADYLLLKPSSLLQLDFERKKIKEIYKEVDEKFKKHSGDGEGKENKGLTYVYSDAYRGFILAPLPSFWTDGLSKSFA